MTETFFSVTETFFCDRIVLWLQKFFSSVTETCLFKTTIFFCIFYKISWGAKCVRKRSSFILDNQDNQFLEPWLSSICCSVVEYIVALHSFLVWLGCGSSLTSQDFGSPISLNLGDQSSSAVPQKTKCWV